jgi:hypothetical protein
MTYNNTVKTSTECINHFVYSGTYETYLGEYLGAVAPADYPAAEEAVGKLALEIISEALWDTLPFEVRDDFELVYSSTYHPRYYNFETDSIVFDFNYSDELKSWLFDYVKDNEAFDKFLYDNYTSRDGFYSYTPNNWHDWLIGWNDYDYRCVSALLAFFIHEEIVKTGEDDSYEYDFNEKSRTLIEENYVAYEYAEKYENGFIGVCKYDYDHEEDKAIFTAWLLDADGNIVNTATEEDYYDESYKRSAYAAYEYGNLGYELTNGYVENRWKAEACEIPEIPEA